jgi:replicative DNA helicase
MTEYGAERALLGCLLSGYPDAAGLLESVRPSDFSLPAHEQIWSTATGLVSTGQQPDPITMRSALGSAANTLPGGPLYLHELMQSAPVVASAPSYADEVRADSVRRRIRTAAIKIGQYAESDLDPVEMADRARSALEDAVETSTSRDLVRIGDVLPAVLDIAQHGRAQGISTPWPSIDRLIRGLQPGRFIVVGARPGVGKSLMGTNIALHVAHHHDHAVVICSMEMPRDEVTQRIVSAHARVNLGSLDEGNLSEAEWSQIQRKTSDVLAMPITIEDHGQQTLTSIRSAITKAKRERDDVAVVIVDYLQLMQVRDPSRNRAEQLGEISRGLKVVARDFGVCVIAMAQVNRESANRADKRPAMSDLRESGSIEADADIVILLHQPEDEPGTLEALVVKNRSGSPGSTRLAIQGHYACIANLTNEPWSPTRSTA